MPAGEKLRAGDVKKTGNREQGTGTRKKGMVFEHGVGSAPGFKIETGGDLSYHVCEKRSSTMIAGDIVFS